MRPRLLAPSSTNPLSHNLPSWFPDRSHGYRLAVAYASESGSYRGSFQVCRACYLAPQLGRCAKE